MGCVHLHTNAQTSTTQVQQIWWLKYGKKFSLWIGSKKNLVVKPKKEEYFTNPILGWSYNHETFVLSPLQQHFLSKWIIKYCFESSIRMNVSFHHMRHSWELFIIFFVTFLIIYLLWWPNKNVFSLFLSRSLCYTRGFEKSLTLLIIHTKKF